MRMFGASATPYRFSFHAAYFGSFGLQGSSAPRCSSCARVWIPSTTRMADVAAERSVFAGAREVERVDEGVEKPHDVSDVGAVHQSLAFRRRRAAVRRAAGPGVADSHLAGVGFLGFVVDRREPLE